MTTDGMASAGQHLDETASDMKQGLAGAIERAEEKVMEFGRSAVTAIDGKRAAAADTLAGAADQLHSSGNRLAQAAHTGGDKVSGLAHGAADTLQSSANYVRDHDLKAMVESVERYVRSNPGKALAVAGVVGFLTARAIRND